MIIVDTVGEEIAVGVIIEICRWDVVADIGNFNEIGVGLISGQEVGSYTLGIKCGPVADAVERPVAQLQRSGGCRRCGDGSTSGVRGSAES